MGPGFVYLGLWTHLFGCCPTRVRSGPEKFEPSIFEMSSKLEMGKEHCSYVFLNVVGKFRTKASVSLELWERRANN